jgi:hypothetical protein
LILSFTTIFINTILVKQAPTIYKKEFKNNNWDDHVNSVVSGNIHRLLFPAKIRINSLTDKVSNDWATNSYWQHIPPLFAYTSLPFFLLDGQVSIEMYRLSFALLIALTSIIFIATVSLFTRSLLATLSATIASIIWVVSPFTTALIHGGGGGGTIFGVSDITLAFTVILSFSAICWYLNTPQPKRAQNTLTKIIFITLLVSLPILAKNVLGAIPVVTFFIMLLIDQKKINLKVLIFALTLTLTLALFYGALFLSSPETFMIEIITPLRHFDNYEYWERPWHFFITNYLPSYYFQNYWYPFITIFLLGLHNLALNKYNRRIRIVLKISIGWYLWSLIATSLVASKSPNFMYQSYLLAIFVSTFTLVWFFHRIYPVFSIIQNKLNNHFRISLYLSILISLLIITSTNTVLATNNAITKLNNHRINNYSYTTTGEKFYELAEYARDNGAGLKDLFIIKPLSGDSWMTYYILFLTGSEARLEQALYTNEQTLGQLKQKFNSLHVVLPIETNTSNIPHTTLATKATDSFQLITFNLANIPKDVDLRQIIYDIR